MGIFDEWNRLQSSDEYWKRPPEVRQAIKRQWFKNNIESLPDFQSRSPESQERIRENFSKAEEYVGYDRGEFMDYASSLGRGVLSTGKQISGAMQMTDLDPTREKGFIARTGGKITNWIDALEESDFFKPDIMEATGQEGKMKQWTRSALESAPASLLPIGAAIAGAAIGGPLVGAGAGVATLFGTFGLGQFQNTYDETVEVLRKQGLPEDEINRRAIKNALTSSTLEVGTEFAGDLAAYLFFMGTGPIGGVLGLSAKQPIKQTLRQLMKLGPKQYAKALGKTIPFEVGSEMWAAYGQAKAAKEAGVPTMEPKEAMWDAVVPAIFLTVGLGSAMHGLNAVQARQIISDINSEDTEKRARAVDQVARRFEDEDIQNEFRDLAMTYVMAGEDIPISKPIADFTYQKLQQEVEEHEAKPTTEDKTTAILKAETIDETVEAFQEPTKAGESPLSGVVNEIEERMAQVEEMAPEVPIQPETKMVPVGGRSGAWIGEEEVQKPKPKIPAEKKSKLKEEFEKAKKGKVEPLNTVGGDFNTMKEMGPEWGGRTRSPQKLYDAGYSVDEVSAMTPLERAKIYHDLEEKPETYTPNALLLKTKDGTVYESSRETSPVHGLMLEEHGVKAEDVVDTGMVDKEGKVLWSGNTKGLKLTEGQKAEVKPSKSLPLPDGGETVLVNEREAKATNKEWTQIQAFAPDQFKQEASKPYEDKYFINRVAEIKKKHKNVEFRYAERRGANKKLNYDLQYKITESKKTEKPTIPEGISEKTIKHKEETDKDFDVATLKTTKGKPKKITTKVRVAKSGEIATLKNQDAEKEYWRAIDDHDRFSTLLDCITS